MPKKTPELDEYKARMRAEANKWEQLGLFQEGPKLTWGDVGDEELRDMVDSVVAEGSALLLARTSDGGALVIQVLSGQGRHKLYPATVAELHEAVAKVTRIAKGL